MDFTKIELIGFKSFADKQQIEFKSGVTAIVGPNGCGKSNVADAVRWVLGEQSAKNMRGTSMVDVIFSGTENRKSLSYCEVSLYFDNSNKIFKNLDYQEVVFTRKLFRKGDSEYLLNNKPCRKMDIVDLLHECGVSKGGYSIIGQGKVGEVLSSKPEDRRMIFEEAIGIAKTKAKRLETSRKLDRTKENIIRLIDIITELERQLEPLSKQADKARNFRVLSEELKHHEVNVYLYKHENASSAKDDINVKIQGIKEQLILRQLDLTNAIESYQKHQNELSSSDDLIRKLNDEILDKTVEMEKQSGTANVYNEKISYLRSENSRLTDEVNLLENQNTYNKSQLQEKKNEIKTTTTERNSLAEKSSKVSDSLMNVIAEISEGEKKNLSAHNKILESAENLAEIRQSIGSLSTEKASLSTSQREVVEKVEELSVKLDDLSNKNTENNLNITKCEKQLLYQKDLIKDKESEIESSKVQISNINQDIINLTSQVSGLEANKRVYSNLKNSYDGFQFAVKKLMQSATTNNELAKRIKGIVANLIKTDSKYDLAIETSLGGAVQNIVTKSPEDAQYLIEFLKRNNAGRVTFLPMSSVKPRYESDRARQSLNEVGAIGFANEIVAYDKEFDGVVRFLLGNTLIVDNIDNGVKIAKRFAFSFKIVTLDGDVLSSNGSMSGGSKRQNTSNLLAMDRKIEEIDNQLKIKFDQLTRQKNKVQDIERQNSENIKERNDLITSYQEVRQELTLCREKGVNYTNQINDLNTEIEKYKYNLSRLKDKLFEIDEKYQNAEAGKSNLASQKEIVSSKAREQQSLFDELTKKRDALIIENTEIQKKLSNAEYIIKSASENIEILEAQMNENAGKIIKNQAIINKNNFTIKELLSELEKVALSDAEKEYLASLRSRLASFEEKKKKIADRIIKDDNNRQTAQDQITILQDKKSQEEIALSKVDTELEFMQQRVWEEYQISYDLALPLKEDNYNATEGNISINKLKRKIAQLGNINANAIEEYKELDTRYQEFITQRDDLLKAENDLQLVIKDLTNEMSSTFQKGFEEIRVHFVKIFKELFGGGRADLILEKGYTEDPLEQGIEILAEPPGKKLGNISLLSGGEKSLTAIAILFAILKLRPMPFCILDEIEAALDDANVLRFANYLRKFSAETQFIVITHKKITMEQSDSLSGVTMPEKGVSTIVSVELKDVEEMIN